MKNLLLIGTGPMAVDYVKILKTMSRKIIVIGRGKQSAQMFKEKTGIVPFIGGVKSYLKSAKIEDETMAIMNDMVKQQAKLTNKGN